MVDFDSFVDWCENRFPGDVIVKGKEVRLNSIFEPGDNKHHLWCNPYGGKYHRESGVYHCFKTDKKGTLIGLVMEVDNCSYEEAKELLSGNTPIGQLEEELDRFFRDKEEEKTVEVKLKLPEYTYLINSLPKSSLLRMEAEDYLAKRKLLSDGLYICSTGDYKNRIIIPYYDSKNKLIYFNGRSMLDKGLRYLGPDKNSGVGKCFGKNTPILMFNGTIKKVQDIKNGDTVVGPDSLPRIVSGVISGNGQLYKIIPTKGDAYVVNEDHILALHYDNGKNKPSKIIISVIDFLKKNKTFKQQVKLYRSSVNYDEQSLLIDPYILGLWLGDGNSSGAALTNADYLIVNAWYQEAKNRGLRIYVDHNGRCPTYHMYGNGRWSNTNTMLFGLQELNLIRNKHVPNEYIVNNRDNRLELLAGYLDTDGCISNNCYDFITKHIKLAEGITQLARSLGFSCYFKETCKRSQTGFEGLYYRGIISGFTNEIPTRLEYKKAHPRKQKKNVLYSGMTIEPIGVGEYYGFTVDKNNLFLLGDFTVVHNSDVIYATSWPCKGSKVYLTEGELDAITLKICGFNGMACGGKVLSDKQIDYLRDYKICLSLDEDQAGFNGFLEIGKKLVCNQFENLTFVRPPVGLKDWNKMLVNLNKDIIIAWIEKYEKPFDEWTESILLCDLL